MTTLCNFFTLLFFASLVLMVVFVFGNVLLGGFVVLFKFSAITMLLSCGSAVVVSNLIEQQEKFEKFSNRTK
jgi:hypothetical protein